jgi:hypothetical protein
MATESPENFLHRQHHQHNNNHHRNNNHETWDISLAIPGYPHPHSQHNRIFAIILAFNFNRIEPITQIIQAYVTMCEAGWIPTVNFLTAMEETPKKLHRYFLSKAYCYRIHKPIPILYRYHNASEHIMLSEHNREYISNHVDSHDLFIYQEEDMIITLTNVMAYLIETKRLLHSAYMFTFHPHESNNNKNDPSKAEKEPNKEIIDRDGHKITLSPEVLQSKQRKEEEEILHYKLPLLMNETLRDYMIGFQRYYRIRDTSKKDYIVNEEELFRREQLNEIPFFYPTCIYGEPYLESRESSFHYIANSHQAIFMLIRHQVKVLQDKCKFLDQRIQQIHDKKNEG